MAADAVQKQAIFLNALQQLLPSARTLSHPQLEKKIGKEKLQEALECTWDYLEDACAEPLQRNERTALCYRALACLRDWMAGQRIPCTVNTMANNFHLIPHAVDQAFPFYASSKLLKFVITGVRAA